MRNPNGFGTVVCLDKTGKKRRKPWAVKVTTGWENNKQIMKYIGYYKDQREAQLALSHYHINGLDVDSNTITFTEMYNLWVKKNEGKMTDENLQAYDYAYQLVPALHKQKLGKLKATHLQNAMNDINKSRSSKAKVKSLIGQMYKYGIENDIVLKNYADFIEINEEQEDKGVPFTIGEIKKLWGISHQYMIEEILILIYTGMRIGEATRVEMKDVHLEERYMYVNGTKSKAAKRNVPIHEDIVLLIEKRSDNKYLFENKQSKQISYTNFRDYFIKIMEQLKLDHKIHDTRKTTVTLMHNAGIRLETIKFIVGHAQSDVTTKVYLKKAIQELKKEIDQVQGLLP